MIKSTELRIGNWYNQFGNYHQVNGAIISELKKAPDSQVWCKPIPLTEEILLKCGFERVESKWRLKDGWHWIEVNLHSYYINGVQYGSIDYLHQLQNLYFALTGEELTINI